MSKITSKVFLISLKGERVTYFMPNTNYRREKIRSRGIYFALAMCLVAIAVAGAATYDSVMEALEPAESSAETSIIPENEDPELMEEVAGPTSAPDDKTEVKETEKTEPESSAEPRETSSSPESSESSEESSEAQAEEETQTAAADYSLDSCLFPMTSTEVFASFGTEPVYSPVMRDYRTHNGVDIAANAGETVRAITGGVVTKTGRDLLLGNFVTIEHGHITATYAGLGDTILVGEGETVTGGMAIGSVHSVPGEDNSTPHLHLEVKRDGTFIDPMSLFE